MSLSLHSAPSPETRPRRTNGRLRRLARQSPSVALCNGALGVYKPLRIVPLDRAGEPEWDRYVLANAHGTLFHSLAWRNAVSATFHHRACYLMARRGTQVVGVLPLFLVRSRLAGPMLVSVPYGVGGGILAEDADAAEALFDEARALAHDHVCAVIDFRSERAVLGTLPSLDRYLAFDRRLPECIEDLPAWLPRKARAAARNARSKYDVRIGVDDQYLRQVWRLYTVSMRRLASLNYPFSFFQRLIDNTPRRHWVSLASWNGCPVAGLVTFLFKDRVIPYFFGSTPSAKRCGAANYMYYSVMERAIAEGYRVFDFGRSRRTNAGSVNFKRFHGFKPHILEYQRYVMPGRHSADLTPDSSRFSFARRIWPHLPLTVTRPLGAYLTKHIPG